ncbi:BLUF domain-containing protein [Sphingomonas sp. LT1P40]|uniref:BLUF domain-containing protein n=1 Tax=Alteristakelama amylovorans TaxID=3096166 RepID=UPI002FCAB0E8
MLQLVYVSSVTPGQVISLGNILTVSRRNNARDGISGLLYADASRFLQALEGPENKLLEAMARIEQDTRHRAVVMLSMRNVETREFGQWAMAHRDPGTDADAVIARIGQLAANASPSVRATFEGFCQVRRAA